MFQLLANQLKRNPVSAYFLMTFLIAWSTWLPLGFYAPKGMLLTLPGIWAPTLSALILIGLEEGRVGIKRFLRKVVHWKVGLGWYLVVLFGIALIAKLAIGLGTLLGIPAPGISMPDNLPREAFPVFLVISFLVNTLIGGPLAEDIGWRGYILPKLRERTTALNASLIIGILWAFWHLPFFIFQGWNSFVGDIPFPWFALLTTSWSVLFAWVYVNTESILLPVLFHAAINTTLGSLNLLGQVGGGLLPMILNTFLTWLAVGIVVFLFGKNLKHINLEVNEREG